MHFADVMNVLPSGSHMLCVCVLLQRPKQDADADTHEHVQSNGIAAVPSRLAYSADWMKPLNWMLCVCFLFHIIEYMDKQTVHSAHTMLNRHRRHHHH